MLSAQVLFGYGVKFYSNDAATLGGNGPASWFATIADDWVRLFSLLIQSIPNLSFVFVALSTFTLIASLQHWVLPALRNSAFAFSRRTSV